MSLKKPRILLIIESCNPDWASVPLVGYRFYEQIANFADVTLVTHQRNEESLRARHPDRDIAFIRPNRSEAMYFKTIARMSEFKGRVVWPLRHTLQFPIYFWFDRAVLQMFGGRIQAGEFDIVHALTPMMPRYPYSAIINAGSTPTILGPVNGGVPFPAAFKKVGIQEFSYFNFLRTVGGYAIPGYRATYRNADLILAGSTYTKNWIQDHLHVPSSKVQLLFENGVAEASFSDLNEEDRLPAADGVLQLLFVGRLVPYKGCDMLLRALAKVVEQNRNVRLTVVGDGAERSRLEDLSRGLGVSSNVEFAGWINQSDTFAYYQKAHLFCFPSIREFGGAVVMEAMACGLPCIVVNNGGIGEYVHEDCGFKIEPLSESHVVDQLARHILHLMGDRELLAQMSRQAFTRSRSFSWSDKGKQLQRIYTDLIAKNAR